MPKAGQAANASILKDNAMDHEIEGCVSFREVKNFFPKRKTHRNTYILPRFNVNVSFTSSLHRQACMDTRKIDEAVDESSYFLGDRRRAGKPIVKADGRNDPGIGEPSLWQPLASRNTSGGQWPLGGSISVIPDAKSK
jgi:hypothetical protein